MCAIPPSLFLTQITPAPVLTTTATQGRRLPRRFCNPALYEVMRIIPLTLRITHYSRAPAAWPGRPTIHVAGDWHTATAPLELARVRGTVEMVASGDVRWTLVRNYPHAHRVRKRGKTDG
jgi:hypothetical protein